VWYLLCLLPCLSLPPCLLRTPLTFHPRHQSHSAVASAHESVFRCDRTHNLIVRLRHNVIRAGLRRTSLAYSRISLADVAAKLGLSSVTDTESIVAKAIRCDGVRESEGWWGGAGNLCVCVKECVCGQD
jgi:hypothetical protein